MQIKTVAEGNTLAGRHDKVPRRLVGQPFEVMLPEGVCGKQTVIPDMPPSGVARILGMIEDGHADGLALHRTVIVTPGGTLSPGGAIAHAFTVHNVALGDLSP